MVRMAGGSQRYFSLGRLKFFFVCFLVFWFFFKSPISVLFGILFLSSS